MSTIVTLPRICDLLICQPGKHVIINNNCPKNLFRQPRRDDLPPWICIPRLIYKPPSIFQITTQTLGSCDQPQLEWVMSKYSQWSYDLGAKMWMEWNYCPMATWMATWELGDNSGGLFWWEEIFPTFRWGLPCNDEKRKLIAQSLIQKIL